MKAKEDLVLRNQIEEMAVEDCHIRNKNESFFKMETDQRIIQAAKELFFRYGIRSVSMDDIAAHLAISKKTIYQYFRDKDELVEKLCRQDMKGHKECFEAIALSSENAIHEIFQLMKDLGEMFSKMNPNLFYDMRKYHPRAWKNFVEFKEREVTRMLEDNLQRGISQGFYRKDIDIKIMARLRIEEVGMAMNPEIFPPSQFEHGRVQLALLDHFLHGITTLKGHKLINKYKQLNEDE